MKKACLDPIKYIQIAFSAQYVESVLGMGVCVLVCGDVSPEKGVECPILWLLSLCPSGKDPG